jgi:hypothetical protein
MYPCADTQAHTDVTLTNTVENGVPYRTLFSLDAMLRSRAAHYAGTVEKARIRTDMKLMQIRAGSSLGVVFQEAIAVTDKLLAGMV